MYAVVDVFVSAMLPAILIIGAGAAFNAVKGVDLEPLNALAMYVLIPALVFHSIADTELGAGVLLRVGAGVVVFTLAMIAICGAYGRLAGIEGTLLNALLLIAAFSNAGSLGIPVSDFVFGGAGRETAVLFAAVQGVLVFTVGVFLASRSGGASGRANLRRVFGLPIVYAVLLALAAHALGVVPPSDAVTMETVGLLGDAAIPVMLIILGIQLSETEAGEALSMTLAPIAFRFAVAPLVGLAIVIGLGFQDPTVARVFILLTAMPAAIAPVIFVVEFAGDAETTGTTIPEFVSTSVLVTTLLSLPILTALIAALQAGLLV